MSASPLGAPARPSFLVSQRFWIYGLLFLLATGVLWWDRENRRAAANESGTATEAAAPQEQSLSR